MQLPTAGAIPLHAAVILALFVLQFFLPAYHPSVLARVMVLAVFAMGYNLTFGYAGLLGLGHAMFFAAGLYGAGLPLYHLGWTVPAAFASGIAAGAVLALIIGLLALRTTGVAFMIVTLSDAAPHNHRSLPAFRRLAGCEFQPRFWRNPRHYRP